MNTITQEKTFLLQNIKYNVVSELEHIKDREISALSGGELQRFACAMVCIQNGDIFMFDEPSSYLDVKQRLNAAQTIRSLIDPDKYVFSHLFYFCVNKNLF